jgi:hypothetical protein
MQTTCLQRHLFSSAGRETNRHKLDHCAGMVQFVPGIVLVEPISAGPLAPFKGIQVMAATTLLAKALPPPIPHKDIQLEMHLTDPIPPVVWTQSCELTATALHLQHHLLCEKTHGSLQEQMEHTETCAGRRQSARDGMQ